MMESLAGFPEGVVAIAAKGRVTKKDYDEVLIPKVHEAVAQRGKIRLYYELGSVFSSFEAGAMWEDLKMGLEYVSRWDRVAIVTDVDWIRLATNVLHFLMPGDMRIFAAKNAAEARAWVNGTSESASSSS